MSHCVNGSFQAVSYLLPLVGMMSCTFSWLDSEYEDPELYSCATGVTFKINIYIHNAYIYSTLQFINHTVKSFASMEAVMQVYILSRHCTIVSMTLAMLMQHQSGRSQCQLQNYWICQLKKKRWK